MGRADRLAERSPGRGRLEVGQVGGGYERHRERDEQDRRLDEGPEGHGPAAAQLGVRAARLRCGRGHGETGQAQDEGAAEDVAHGAQRQGIGGQHRYQERDDQVAGEGQHGTDTNTQLGAVRDERLLAEQLGQVVVRLEDPRAPPALNPGFEMGDPAAHDRGEDQDGEDLEDLYVCRR